jgi:hypothetical protein
MTYSDFKQLIADAQNDDHMKVNLVDASFKKEIWNSVNNYINYLDNIEQFNDRYIGRISYEPEYDARGRIAKVYNVIHHPALEDVPERDDWMLWEVIYK